MKEDQNNWSKEFHDRFQVVPIGYHKCEGWNDEDTMEIDTAYIDPKPMIAWIKSNMVSKAELREMMNRCRTEKGLGIALARITKITSEEV